MVCNFVGDVVSREVALLGTEVAVVAEVEDLTDTAAPNGQVSNLWRRERVWALTTGEMRLMPS